jgi:hypothetical protein
VLPPFLAYASKALLERYGDGVEGRLKARAALCAGRCAGRARAQSAPRQGLTLWLWRALPTGQPAAPRPRLLLRARREVPGALPRRSLPQQPPGALVGRCPLSAPGWRSQALLKPLTPPPPSQRLFRAVLTTASGSTARTPVRPSHGGAAAAAQPADDLWQDALCRFGWYLFCFAKLHLVDQDADLNHLVDILVVRL